MPTLLDLFRVNSKALNYNDVVDRNRIPERLRNLPPAPVKPEYDQMIEDFRRSFEQQ